MYLLKAEHLVKRYGALEVLKGIRLTIQKKSVVSIVGASGAGKSTLLHMLGTLDKPDHGRIMLGHEDLTTLEGNALASFRNKKMGFVFQFHNLLPEFNALENVCLPGYIGKRPTKEVEERGMWLMELLRVDHRRDHKPSEMSGGEQQRIAVARALINSPSIVFADEPSGNLDSKNAEELHNLFFRLRDELGQTFVIVTHNMHFARLADTMLEIADGLIVGQDTK